MDHVLEYMKKNNIPLTRENYIDINWLGEYSACGEDQAEVDRLFTKKGTLRKEVLRDSQ